MIFTIILSGIITLLGIIFLKLFQKHKFFKNHGIPHESPVPIFGNILPVLLRKLNVSDLIRNLYDAYPNTKYFGLYDFTNPGIVIRDLELMKLVGVKNFEHFTDHGMFGEEPRDPLFGKNLFLLKGKKWHDVRCLLSPAFTLNKLKIMFPLISHCAKNYAEILSTNSGEIREMKETFNRFSNDVILNCAFGININTINDPTNEFYTLGKEATNMEKLTIKVFLMREFPFLMNFFNINLVNPRIYKFFKKIITTTIETRDTLGIKRPDMLQLLMNSKRDDNHGDNDKINLTQDEKIAQGFVFYFGGFDATSTTISCAAHELAVNLHIQRKLQTKIDKILLQTNGNLSYDVIIGFDYLDAIVNETLRKYPILPVLDRVCTKQFEFPPTVPGAKPFLVEPGMTIWIPVIGYHYDPKYYVEPEKFNPDRFLKNGAASNKAATFLSFGIGPRQCIANRFASLKIKIMLFHLLARCNLKVCSKTNVPLKASKKTLGFFADGGYWMELEKRKNSFYCKENSHC
ncbi:cytochrome P450 9e2-like [Leptopilina heterotoma]|uniref:cytochrome P450 9e2-like n=1 Tax=Leptopilina heterotoma TaxID=63436 RepID=UPI001CA9AA79|nr:cytochrome P450 9e2-like [Leptopilina heterotoma]